MEIKSNRTHHIDACPSKLCATLVESLNPKLCSKLITLLIIYDMCTYQL